MLQTREFEPQTDDGVAPSSLDQLKDDNPDSEVTGYGYGGGVY